jgi:hypothetical protein
MSDLATQSPKEIDAQLASIWTNALPLQRAIAETRRSIGRYDRACARVPAYLTERLADQEAQIAAVRAAAEPFEAEFRRRPWNRYFIVPDGHVHRSWCSTLRPTTERGWLPEHSGADEAAIVATFKFVACTVCFSSAPVEPHLARPAREGQCREISHVTGARCELDAAKRHVDHSDGETTWRVPSQAAAKAEARQERAVKAAEKKAKQEAAAIFDVDGGRLKGAWNDVLRTLAAAEAALVDAIEGADNLAIQPHARVEYAAVRDRVAPAIAKKTGQTVTAVLEAARGRLERRNKRNRF